MTSGDVVPGGVARGPHAFRHEVLLYADEDEFVRGTTDFIRRGLERDEAILTVVDTHKIARLRTALEHDADRVQFADMSRVGHNPARIIQAWRDFVGQSATHGLGMRGIGEPITPDRNPAALDECHIHESLLNLAFDTDPNFWLLCPYDVSALPARVVEEAIGNHPYVHDHAARWAPPDPFTRAWTQPPAETAVLAFGTRSTRAVRGFARSQAAAAGIPEPRAGELVVAVSEIATNAIVHGHSTGEARAWIEDDHLVIEIRSAGRITDPLVGRVRPAVGQLHGYGVWLANQFCDLVRIRSSAAGTSVRLHTERQRPLTASRWAR